MSASIRLAILGGDERQTVMARELTKMGYSVAVWGLGKAVEPRRDLPTALENWREAIKDANAIILPLPMTADGIHIRSPLHSGDPLRWKTLLEHAHTDQTLLVGRGDAHFLRSAEEKGFSVTDYFFSEDLQLKNAMLTAEGAISLAMDLLPVAVYGCEMAVIGYGRIGRLLADRLAALGASVTVYARRQESLTEAELNRCRGRRLWSKEADLQRLEEEFSDCRVIFNTVPDRLLGREALLRIPRRCLLIDLASVPGGIDQKAAESLGIRSVWATALPGKYASESAGGILAETVDGLMEKP